MSLPSAVHVSSIIKRGASGDWEICFSVIFRIGSFAKHVYMCICILYSLFLLLFVFCFVQKKKEGVETRVVITERQDGRNQCPIFAFLLSPMRGK